LTRPRLALGRISSPFSSLFLKIDFCQPFSLGLHAYTQGYMLSLAYALAFCAGTSSDAGNQNPVRIIVAPTSES